MEKKTPQKEEPLSPYQQSIQKFTEQIMDLPSATTDSPEAKKQTPDTKDSVKGSDAARTASGSNLDLKMYFLNKK